MNHFISIFIHETAAGVHDVSFKVAMFKIDWMLLVVEQQQVGC